MGESLKNLQRMDALEEANFIRYCRMNLKRNLKEGNIDAIDLIKHPPPYIKTMKLFDLLVAAPRIRQPTAKRILCLISPYTTVGELTIRQRDAVIARIQKIRGE
jgi:hypothetical protein